MRIALLFSGQARHYREAIESQSRRLRFAADDDIHIFCFFWSVNPVETAPLYEDLRASFAAKHAEIRLAKPFTPKLPAVYESFPESKVENIFHMHRALWECNLMRERFEQASGRAFDLCVRTRPDLTLTSDLDVADYASLCKDFILTPRNGYHRHGVNDQFALSGGAGMSIYCRVFGTIESYVEHGIRLHSESLLRAHLVANQRKFVCGDFRTLLMKDGAFVVG